MSVQSSHSSDGEGSVPETPMIAQSLNRPMMSPPRMLSQQVQLEGSGVTRSPLNNLTSNNDGHNHIDNDTNDHEFFTVRTSLDRSTLLNFPAMQQSHLLPFQSSPWAIIYNVNNPFIVNQLKGEAPAKLK